MGFECGIQSANLKDAKGEPLLLVYLGNPGDDVDELMMRYAKLNGETIKIPSNNYDCETGVWTEGEDEVKNDGYEYKLDMAGINSILDQIKRLYTLCRKYSNRVIDELNDYLSDSSVYDKPAEVSKADLAEIKDELFTLSTGYSELWSFIRLGDSLFALARIDESVTRGGLIYWRSW